MKTIAGLALFLVLVIGAGVLVAGTIAYLNDTETSSSNQLVAGTLDLKTDDVDGVSQTLYATSMAPGDTVGPSTIQLKNSGSLYCSTVDIAFSYIESDNSPNIVNMSEDEMAAMLEVITLSYDGSSLLGSVSDDNTNSYKDVYDLANADLSGQSGLDASAIKDFQIAIQFRSETGNDYQADGINLTMTFTLNQ